MVVHIFNPSAWEAEARGSLSLRPAWSDYVFPLQIMESTQVIDWDAEEEEETELSSGSLGYSVEPIGQLRLFSGTHGPERGQEILGTKV